MVIFALILGYQHDQAEKTFSRKSLHDNHVNIQMALKAIRIITVMIIMNIYEIEHSGIFPTPAQSPIFDPKSAANVGTNS